MSTEQVRALVERWHRDATVGAASKKTSKKAVKQLRICADELLAALEAPPAGDRVSATASGNLSAEKQE